MADGEGRSLAVPVQCSKHTHLDQNVNANIRG